MTTYVRVPDPSEEDGYYICNIDDAPDTVHYGQDATAEDFTAVFSTVHRDEVMFGPRWARRPTPTRFRGTFRWKFKF